MRTAGDKRRRFCDERGGISRHQSTVAKAASKENEAGDRREDLSPCSNASGLQAFMSFDHFEHRPSCWQRGAKGRWPKVPGSPVARGKLAHSMLDCGDIPCQVLGELSPVANVVLGQEPQAQRADWRGAGGGAPATRKISRPPMNNPPAAAPCPSSPITSPPEKSLPPEANILSTPWPFPSTPGAWSAAATTPPSITSCRSPAAFPAA